MQRYLNVGDIWTDSNKRYAPGRETYPARGRGWLCWIIAAKIPGQGEVSMEINAKERRKDRRTNSGDSIPLWLTSQMKICKKWPYDVMPVKKLEL
jgi:hypothetical protein